MTKPDDTFMYALRREVDPAFDHALKQRIDHAPKRHFAPRRALKLALVASLAALLVLVASPEIRAQITQQVEQLFYGDVELRVVSRVSGGHEGGVSTVPTETLSDVDAQTIYAHKVPTWSPDGFTREDGVHAVYYSDDEIYMGYRWTEDEDHAYHLSIMQYEKPRLVIGEDNHAEEVHVNENTGTLFVGGWDNQGFFNGDQLNLVWVDDGVTYYLMGTGVSREDLLRVAESVQ